MDRDVEFKIWIKFKKNQQSCTKSNSVIKNMGSWEKSIGRLISWDKDPVYAPKDGMHSTERDTGHHLASLPFWSPQKWHAVL